MTNSILLDDIAITWQGLPGGLILITFGAVTIYWQLKRPAEDKRSPIRGWLVGLGAIIVGGLFIYKSYLWLMQK